MNQAPHARTPHTPPVTIPSDQSANPQSASRSTSRSQAGSRSVHHATAPAAAAAQAAYDRNESGTWSGYQIVRMSGGGQRRSPGNARAAAIAARSTARSG